MTLSILKGAGGGLLEFSEPITTTSTASLVRLRVVSVHMQQNREAHIRGANKLLRTCVVDLNGRTRMTCNVLNLWEAFGLECINMYNLDLSI